MPKRRCREYLARSKCSRRRCRCTGLFSPARARLEAGNLPGVHLLDRLEYLEFLCLQASTAITLTDSGGIHEETTVLGVDWQLPPLSDGHAGERFGAIPNQFFSL